MRSCNATMENRPPHSCSAGQRPCLGARSRHAAVVLSVKISGCNHLWSQERTDILGGTGVWPRHGEMRHCVFNYGDSSAEEGLPENRVGSVAARNRPMPSCGRIWRRLSNIPLTDARWRCFHQNLRRRINIRQQSPRAAVCGLRKQTGALKDVNYTNQKEIQLCLKPSER